MKNDTKVCFYWPLMDYYRARHLWVERFFMKINVIEATSRHRIPFSFLGHLSPIVERNSSLCKWLLRWKDELAPKLENQALSREIDYSSCQSELLWSTIFFTSLYMSGRSNEDIRLVISVSLSVYGSNCTLTNSFDTICTCNGSVSMVNSVKVW